MSDAEKTEALVQLAGTMAHELNNIFTAVTGNLSLLEGAFDGDDGNAQVVSDVIRTAKRGIELSSRLQAFAGRQAFRRCKIDLNRAIAEVSIELKRSLLRSVDVELELLPGECIVVADGDRLRAVLAELASNAAAAMGHRGWLTMATSLAENTGQLPGLAPGRYGRILMRDCGCGMSPQVAKRALDPLFSTKSQSVDAGWGLSKAAGFARQSGGQIFLSSQLGQGTTVELYLPLAA